MDTLQLFRGVELFDGLNDDELARLLALCREARFQKGDIITRQGQPGSEMFIVREGLVEVSVGAPGTDTPPQTVINLGAGQVVGEMALVDGGPRSATVRCVTANTTVHVIERDAFEQLCQADHHIGLIVYRNLAADLSFKLRHRNLARR
jgi:CRP-like cAMP-binding protein